MNGIKCDTYMYTMEHFSAFNRKEILTHAAIWMTLKMLYHVKYTDRKKQMRKSKAVIRNVDAGSRSWLHHFPVFDSVWRALPL